MRQSQLAHYMISAALVIFAALFIFDALGTSESS